MIKKLIKRHDVQLVLCVVVGIVIGAVFYPTSSTEEKVRKEYETKLSRQDEMHQKKETEYLELLHRQEREKHSLEIEYTRKVAVLSIQIKELQSKTKEGSYKIVRPDGTIEERQFKESEISESTKVVLEIREEFDSRIKEINERYEKVHSERVIAIKEDFERREKDYHQTISKLESENKKTINPKRYGVEGGYLSTEEYYGHVNIDVFGPVFLGLHTQTDLKNQHAVGAGVGVRF